MITPPVERVGEMICQVGECPVWHAAEQALYWTDIPARRLWRWDAGAASAHSWDMPEMTGCMTRTGEGWLLAMESGIFACGALQPGQAAPAPVRQAAAPHPAPGMRFNDGRCDRQGRFWASTMLLDMSAPLGQLYRYDGRGLSAPVLEGLHVPNGMAFSPDGRTMYLSDSHPSRQLVWAFDYDPDAGLPHNRRLFADLRPLPGRPDGAAMDQDGCYWICGNDAGVVHRYTPAGKLDRSIPVPAAKVTMCAFGGARLDTLYVTSLRPAGAAGAMDGAVFALRPGVLGMEETAYAG
jgi:sugar lactone lactonase YvrE